MQAASQFEFATSGLDAESFEVDDGTILFAESSGRLVLLNATAASIWHGLKFGLFPEEISSELAIRSELSAKKISADCATLIESLQELKLLDRNSESLTNTGTEELSGVTMGTSSDSCLLRPDRLALRELLQPADLKFNFRTGVAAASSYFTNT